MMGDPQNQQPESQPTQPEKVFGKFNDMKAAEEGYWNAVNEMNRTKEQLGMAVNMIETLRGSGQPQPQSKPEYVAELDKYGIPTHAINQLVEAKASEIAQQIVQQHFNPLVGGAQARQQMAGTYEDFAQHEADVMKTVKNNPELKARFDDLLVNNRPYDALELAYFHWARTKPVKPATEQDNTKNAAGLPDAKGGAGRIQPNLGVDKLQRIQQAGQYFQETKDFMPLFNEVLGDRPLTWTEQMSRLGQAQ